MKTVVVAILCCAVLAAIVVTRLMSSMVRAGVQQKQMASSFVADPNNETSISIRGWSHAEIDKILADFFRAYSLPGAAKVAEKSSDIFVVTFPNDVQPEYLFYLVNYVKYPKNFDLAGRSLGVLCRVVLTPAFGAPDAALTGKRAIIYVPENDTEYDLVYVQIESGRAYEVPFTNLIWKPVADARLPHAIAGL